MPSSSWRSSRTPGLWDGRMKKDYPRFPSGWEWTRTAQPGAWQEQGCNPERKDLETFPEKEMCSPGPAGGHSSCIPSSSGGHLRPQGSSWPWLQPRCPPRAVPTASPQAPGQAPLVALALISTECSAVDVPAWHCHSLPNHSLSSSCWILLFSCVNN